MFSAQRQKAAELIHSRLGVNAVREQKSTQEYGRIGDNQQGDHRLVVPRFQWTQLAFLIIISVVNTHSVILLLLANRLGTCSENCGLFLRLSASGLRLDGT